MLIDTHCHLDAAEFDADREAVVARAEQQGISGIVVPAVERSNFAAVSSICRDYALCRPAYGIHPMYVNRAREGDLDALLDTLSRNDAVAIGEIGLDYFVPDHDKDRQDFWFSAQLRIARDTGLPVILHVRKAVDAVLAQLRRIKVSGGIAHAFNGSRQQADEFMRLGFRLGFGGAMTHPRATRLRDLAATLPLESIVLETDAPDIPPEWLGRGRNEPGELHRIAGILAELRGMPLSEVIAATGQNAQAVLPGIR